MSRLFSFYQELVLSSSALFLHMSVCLVSLVLSVCVQDGIVMNSAPNAFSLALWSCRLCRVCLLFSVSLFRLGQVYPGGRFERPLPG